MAHSAHWYKQRFRPHRLVLRKTQQISHCVTQTYRDEGKMKWKVQGLQRNGHFIGCEKSSIDGFSNIPKNVITKPYRLKVRRTQQIQLCVTQTDWIEVKTKRKSKGLQQNRHYVGCEKYLFWTSTFSLRKYLQNHTNLHLDFFFMRYQKTLKSCDLEFDSKASQTTLLVGNKSLSLNFELSQKISKLQYSDLTYLNVQN